MDPDFELGWEGGRGGRWWCGLVLLALPAFLPTVVSSFFTQIKGGPPPLALP